jgi:predicted N-acyltransferase
VSPVSRPVAPSVPAANETREGPFTVKRATDIIAFDPAAWDAVLDPDDLQTTHRFISVCQRARVESATYRHLMVLGDGEVNAVASFSRMNVRIELLSPTPFRSLVNRARRWAPRLLQVPVAFCGLPVSFGRPCLALRRGADRAAIVSILARELQAWAEETGADILCFKEFPPQEERDVASLASLGYIRATSLPSCHLELGWPTFDAYVGAMRTGYRRQLEQTLRQRERQGLSVRTVEDFGAACESLFALYQQIMDRAPYQLERLNLRFFEGLNDLGSETKAVLLEQEGRLGAAAILLVGPRVVTFLLAGIDYSIDRRCQAYPNVVIETVAEAIRCGATRLEMGQTSYDLKRRLGAVTESRGLYIRYRRPVRHALVRAASGLLFPTHTLAPRRVFRVN